MLHLDQAQDLLDEAINLKGLPDRLEGVLGHGYHVLEATVDVSELSHIGLHSVKQSNLLFLGRIFIWFFLNFFPQR